MSVSIEEELVNLLALLILATQARERGDPVIIGLRLMLEFAFTIPASATFESTP